MAELPALCQNPNCGLQFSVANIVRGSGTFTLSGNYTRCPKCGSTATFVDGTFNIVRDVVAAFKAPGVAREDIAAFKELAEAVQRGDITSEKAEERLAEIGSALFTLWVSAKKHGWAIGLMLSIISIYLACYAIQDSDITARRAHDDSVRIEQSLDNQQAMQKHIYEELLTQRLPAPQIASSQKTKPVGQRVSHSQKPKQNRHERRKALSAERSKRH